MTPPHPRPSALRVSSPPPLHRPPSSPCLRRVRRRRAAPYNDSTTTTNAPTKSKRTAAVLSVVLFSFLLQVAIRKAAAAVPSSSSSPPAAVAFAVMSAPPKKLTPQGPTTRGPSSAFSPPLYPRRHRSSSLGGRQQLLQPSSSSSPSPSSPPRSLSSTALFFAEPELPGASASSAAPQVTLPLSVPSSPTAAWTRYKLPPLMDWGRAGGGGGSRRGTAFCASASCNDPKCYVDRRGPRYEDEDVPDLLFCSFIEPSPSSPSPSSSSFGSGRNAVRSPGAARGENPTDDEMSNAATASSRLSYPPGLTRAGMLPPTTTTPKAARRRGRGRPDSFGAGNRPDDPVVVLYQRGRPPRTRATDTRSNQSARTERLLQLSNVASVLCVVDCTVLPLATIGLSVASSLAAAAASATATATAPGSSSVLMAVASPALASWIGEVSPLLHEWGHLAALYFVVPVGALASTVNYSVHRSMRIAAFSAVGLLLVVAANAGCGPHGFLPALEAFLPHPWGHAIHRAAHAIHHHAVLHRLVNLLGCAFLLFGNHLSRQHSACANANCRC